MISKKSLAVLVVGFLIATPVFGQRFTKKEQARREARAANYFYGASFTITAGYNHSWALDREIELSTPYFGKSERLQNTYDSFNFGALYDHSLNRYWGLQTGLFYTQKGCDHTYFYDNKTSGNYGANLYKTEEQRIQGIEWQGNVRRFFVKTYYSRFSLNAGLYVNKIIESPSTFKNWDLGVQVGLGYDYKHLTTSFTYQPGIYPKVARNSDTRLGTIMFNVGWRLWRK